MFAITDSDTVFAADAKNKVNKQQVKKENLAKESSKKEKPVKESSKKESPKKERPKNKVKKTVYEDQSEIGEKELLSFLDILPKFRAWARENKEEAHPFLDNGKPNFKYSQKAAQWVRLNHWEPMRFFCVMGRAAAAVVIVEEGNDMQGTRPKDMPTVSEKELNLVRKHLGSILKAGSDVQTQNP